MPPAERQQQRRQGGGEDGLLPAEFGDERDQERRRQRAAEQHPGGDDAVGEPELARREPALDHGGEHREHRPLTEPEQRLRRDQHAEQRRAREQVRGQRGGERRRDADQADGGEHRARSEALAERAARQLAGGVGGGEGHEQPTELLLGQLQGLGEFGGRHRYRRPLHIRHGGEAEHVGVDQPPDAQRPPHDGTAPGRLRRAAAVSG